MKKTLLSVSFAFAVSAAFAQWPAENIESRPGTRWWWLGSAVDSINLNYNLSEYAKAGIGSVEITPIYGVKGNDKNEISFLSPKWMDMLSYTEQTTRKLSMFTDMNTGTGWPFGGPEISIEDAACKLIVQKYTLNGGELLKEKVLVNDKSQQPFAYLSRLMAISDDGKQRLDITSDVDTDGTLFWGAPGTGKWNLIALFVGRTLQKVKRAAPGGEGFVMDHFSTNAVKCYLNKFDRAFARMNTLIPHNFFNDSYEVYGADWTPNLLEEFAKRRGYKLENYLPEFLDENRPEITRRIMSDYRETLSDLLLDNFTSQWTAWAHRHGSKTRNQAHGSPGNLIDLYACVDVPECEGFGLSDFNITGLRKDSLVRKNDSELSMLKYASSAAHITGKPLTSSETFTWLTEHFRTSLSQCKPDLDLFFVSGINHVFFHGSAYSPQNDPWPGWKFYASIDMSPTNTIWKDAPAFFKYITRCQSFLQMGKPDNDFLVYLPIYDMWYDAPGRLLQFAINDMEKRAPQFIKTIHTINSCGYDVDYISDKYISSTICIDHLLKTTGGTQYKAIIVPSVRFMPQKVLRHLFDLANEGATVIFTGNYPESEPGFQEFSTRTAVYRQLIDQMPQTDFKKVTVTVVGKGQIITGSDYVKTLAATGVHNEPMKSQFGLQCIRRTNDSGYHYFISCLQGKNIDGWIPLSIKAQSIQIFNPLNGESGKALVRYNPATKRSEVRLQLQSGESCILKTYSSKEINDKPWHYLTPNGKPIKLNKWTVQFIDSEPSIEGSFTMKELKSWTELPIADAKVNKGTALYKTTVKIPGKGCEWNLSLGDVRESAKIRINGQDAGTLFSVPFSTKVTKFLKPGKNTIEIEVTNLPANRIADYDRKGIQWRKFKEINIVNIKYQPSDYSTWQTVPSGLLGPVILQPSK